MDNTILYQDIAKRTDGDIYVGVVGPVRTGKSTFIKRFMDLLVIPNIDNEYKIKVGDTYNYIDLLLYNIKFKCYVVIELKVTKLKKEHTGQIQTYMNYIDRNVKEVNDNKTVGIIICKKNNEYVIDYCSDNRVIAREYELV